MKKRILKTKPYSKETPDWLITMCNKFMNSGGIKKAHDRVQGASPSPGTKPEILLKFNFGAVFLKDPTETEPLDKTVIWTDDRRATKYPDIGTNSGSETSPEDVRNLSDKPTTKIQFTTDASSGINSFRGVSPSVNLTPQFDSMSQTPLADSPRIDPERIQLMYKIKLINHRSDINLVQKKRLIDYEVQRLKQNRLGHHSLEIDSMISNDSSFDRLNQSIITNDSSFDRLNESIITNDSSFDRFNTNKTNNCLHDEVMAKISNDRYYFGHKDSRITSDSSFDRTKNSRIVSDSLNLRQKDSRITDDSSYDRQKDSRITNDSSYFRKNDPRITDDSSYLRNKDSRITDDSSYDRVKDSKITNDSSYDRQKDSRITNDSSYDRQKDSRIANTNITNAEDIAIPSEEECTFLSDNVKSDDLVSTIIITITPADENVQTVKVSKPTPDSLLKRLTEESKQKPKIKKTKQSTLSKIPVQIKEISKPKPVSPLKRLTEEYKQKPPVKNTKHSALSKIHLKEKSKPQIVNRETADKSRKPLKTRTKVLVQMKPSTSTPIANLKNTRLTKDAITLSSPQKIRTKLTSVNKTYDMTPSPTKSRGMLNSNKTYVLTSSPQKIEGIPKTTIKITTTQNPNNCQRSTEMSGIKETGLFSPKTAKKNLCSELWCPSNTGRQPTRFHLTDITKPPTLRMPTKIYGSTFFKPI